MMTGRRWERERRGGIFFLVFERGFTLIPGGFPSPTRRTVLIMAACQGG